MDGIDRLPPLREVIAAHGLDARKRLGQHFLLDLNLTRRIARGAAPLDQGLVIEVGPGPGGLTRALLLEGAGHVVAVEIDERAIAALGGLQAAAEGRLELRQADALNMVLMFQKEVVDRLLAAPRSKDYGRLSVVTQHVCTAQRLFDIPPSAFVPPPKVVSSVVRLTPRPAAERLADLRPLERVTAAAFGQRRKMLRSALKGHFADPERVLSGLGLSPTARAEELAVADFVRLAAA